ncbi:hypothetical protein G3I60_05355 [Streptomyces sp. SID13666]|uniref:hypothetical protein n=1 Tax=Streptomyces sp. SID13666 TaxID=2706054 RepID=UPI0013BED2C0|nr:hypothetical protein [Streptomyces sp. SID13666]NEA53598.1 hypothetical protein [Streptomyces sp. SID13666]
MDGLPEDSRTRSSAIGGWTVQTELLAQLIEEVSLIASERRRETPREIHRPYPQAERAPRELTGHRQMLAAAQRRGQVRSSG